MPPASKKTRATKTALVTLPSEPGEATTQVTVEVCCEPATTQLPEPAVEAEEPIPPAKPTCDEFAYQFLW